MALDCFPMELGPVAAAADVIGGWRVTSWPGARTNPLTGRPGTHGKAIDLAHAGCFGEPFYAVADGVAVQSIDGSLTSAGGRWTRLEVRGGQTYGYGHANRFAEAPGVDPRNGGRRQVKAGDLLGYIGSTGGSTGAHMHFQPLIGDVVAMLREAADAGRFPGATAPIPNPTPPAPAPSEEDDEMQLWRRSDSSDVYGVGMAAKMGPEGDDSALAYFGGLFRYKFRAPGEVALAAGPGWESKVSIIDTASADPNVKAQLAYFEGMPLIYAEGS